MTPSPDYARGIVDTIRASHQEYKHVLVSVLDVLDHLEHGNDEEAEQELARLLHDCENETARADKAEAALASLTARLADIERDGYIPERMRGPYDLHVYVNTNSEDAAYSEPEQERRSEIRAFINRHLTPTLIDPRD